MPSRKRSAGPRSGRAAASLLRYYEALRSHFGPQDWWPAQTRCEVVVGAVLTQNTAWGNVELAITNLRNAGLLHLQRLHTLGPVGIAPFIRPAGYFNVKARRLWNLVDYLMTQHGGALENLAAVDTPTLRAQLLGINGIGKETADSILLYALDRPVFVVDAYTRRMAARHGLVSADAGYDAVQAFFVERLPRDRELYTDYHAQIVMAGKHFCKPQPRCGGCPLRHLLPRPPKE